MKNISIPFLKDSLKYLKTQQYDSNIEEGILKLLIGELETIQSRDKSRLLVKSDIVKVIKKLIKSNNETLSYGHQDKLVRENEFLTSFLPEELSDEQIKVMVENYIISGFNMGQIMKMAKSDMGDQFDGKRVSTIAKGLM